MNPIIIEILSKLKELNRKLRMVDSVDGLSGEEELLAVRAINGN